MVALVLAYQLLAAAPQCNVGTTYDMRTCWAKASDAATAALKSTYAAAEAALSKRGNGTAQLAASQAAWTGARDKMCAFEYDLYLPGTIAPQIGTQCDVRMTQARTQRLAALLQQNTRPREETVAPSTDAELTRIYRLYLERLDKSQASSLRAAETAWTSYRDAWCAIEGGACLTALTNERVTELKDSWIGEAFW